MKIILESVEECDKIIAELDKNIQSFIKGKATVSDWFDTSIANRSKRRNDIVLERQKLLEKANEPQQPLS